ncbi:MAG: acyl-CoA dehydrogenase family protein [Dehalococcoidia bacterium]
MLLFPRTDRQTKFVQLAASFVPAFAERAAEHDRAGTFPFENFAALRGSGYHTLPIAERFGGMGADLLEVVLAQLTLARGDGSTALSMNMHLMTMGIAGEVHAWPEATFESICQEVVREGALLNSAAAEPELGSPASGGQPATLARPVDGGWRISGRKTFVSASPELTYFIVLATIEGPESPPRVANFLVRNGSPGIRIEPTWDVLGMRATASNDVVFDDVFVGDDAILMERPLGRPDARGGANTAWFGLTASAVYLGVAEAARDFAVEFANARTPTALGKPISDLPAVQWKAADMEIALLAGRTLVLSAAEDWVTYPDRRSELLPGIAAAKTVAMDNAIRTVDLAMRIVGGVGMYKQFPLERYYRDVRAGLSHPPIEDRAREQIGKTALGLTPPPARGPQG